MIDLEPATNELSHLVQGVRDDQLTAPTPCGGMTLGALLDHVNGLAQAFTLGARKVVPEGGSPAPSADASRLDPDWREQIPARLAVLAQAWADPEAWTGVAEVGGVTSPGEATGMFALDEVLVHGWDLAVASGQSFEIDTRLVQANYEFVHALVSGAPDGIPGLFGPPVPVPDGASWLDRLIGLTGRNPHWTSSI